MAAEFRITEASANLSGPSVIDRAAGAQYPLDSVAVVESEGWSLVVNLGRTPTNEIGFSRISVSAEGSDGDGQAWALKPTDLASIPWPQVLDAVVARVAVPVELFEEGDRIILRTTSEMVEDWEPDKAVRASRNRGRPKGSTRGPDEAELRKVAAVYIEAVDRKQRDPVAQVARQCHYPLSTAGRRVEAARQAGFIPEEKRAKRRKP
jgi:hypothetical protein